MYDLAGFLIGNPIDRFGIGNMAEKLPPDPDGGLTLLIQHDSPGTEQETNWLPAPPEGFFLMSACTSPRSACTAATTPSPQSSGQADKRTSG